MDVLDTPEARLALSLALGLLVGVERERKKQDPAHTAIAGLRTFGLTAFFGGLCAYVAVPYAVLVGALLVGAMVIVGYALDPNRIRDLGLTTEVALLVTYFLGVVAMTRPDVAAASTFVVTLVLSFKTTLHRFVRETLTEEEMRDGLLVLIFAFVVLPLAPDVDIGPYQAINPQRIARVVLVVLSIGAGGYVAQRVLGRRYGLLVSGFAAGFISSSATIASMGLRAKADPSSRDSAVAAGIASSVATVVLYAVLVAAVDVSILPTLFAPLGFALVAALLGMLVFARRKGQTSPDAPKGRAFQWLPSLLVGVAAAVLSIIGAALGDRLGRAGMVIVSTVAGFVDAHATTASIATLTHSGRLPRDQAALSVVAALSSNTVTKIVMASLSRDVGYALRLSAGVIAIAAAAWLGLFVAAL